MRRTGIADVNDFVCNSVLAVGGAGVDAMNMVDAAANGVLLNNSETHDD